MCFISTSPRFNYDINIYFHLSQMQFAGPEEIDDGSKTPRVAIKIKLVVLENLFFKTLLPPTLKMGSDQGQNVSHVQIELVRCKRSL